MARDYLGVPATSCDVERLFSEARNMVVANRSSLNPSTIRKCQLLMHWLKQFPELINVVSLRVASIAL